MQLHWVQVCYCPHHYDPEVLYVREQIKLVTERMKLFRQHTEVVCHIFSAGFSVTVAMEAFATSVTGADLLRVTCDVPCPQRWLEYDAGSGISCAARRYLILQQ
jgi:hypothetical protein